jgi:hypothetical protein
MRRGLRDIPLGVLASNSSELAHQEHQQQLHLSEGKMIANKLFSGLS